MTDNGEGAVPVSPATLRLVDPSGLETTTVVVPALLAGLVVTIAGRRRLRARRRGSPVALWPARASIETLRTGQHIDRSLMRSAAAHHERSAGRLSNGVQFRSQPPLQFYLPPLGQCLRSAFAESDATFFARRLPVYSLLHGCRS
jgi:hypothetical protein